MRRALVLSSMELMRSRAFITDFVERRHILPELFAVESWDVSSGEIIFDPEVYDATSQTWVSAHKKGKNPILRPKRPTKCSPKY